MDIVLVLGARPQIIKSAIFIYLAKKEKKVDLAIVHTGQHYDYEMTRIFFEELHLPDPIVNLNVGSGTHAEQTGKIMMRLERILREQGPDLVIVPGDTNSTLAGALTSAKLKIPAAHLEAGARSFDRKMPEEINRCLTDHCSTLLFTPTKNCTRNLLKEGVERNKIHEIGDTMYDVLLKQLPKAEETTVLRNLDLEPKTYALLTTHRPENVDNRENLESIIDAVSQLGSLTIVFPVHPRTQRQLRRFKLYKKARRLRHIKMIKPVGYRETLKLIKNAAFILTDSGGIQKESFWLRTPCITLRKNTEWMETIQLGANFLVGTNSQKITKAARKIIENEEEMEEKLNKLPNPFGNGRASKKMLETIKTYLNQSDAMN